jgi:hypothetical protein
MRVTELFSIRGLTCVTKGVIVASNSTPQGSKMNRIGTVLIFKPEVSKSEAAMALNSIRNLLDLPAEVASPAPHILAAIDRGETVRFRPEEWVGRPFKITDTIHEYDDEWGGPVWYIP